MSEYTEVMYCAKCGCRQPFLVAGNSLYAICPGCEDEIYGNRILVARAGALKDFKEKIVFDKLFEKMLK